MSIYIRGLSLPPEGEKRLVLFIGPDGVVDVYRSVVEATPHLESIVCETDAIEVPPHGRLIDADAMAAKDDADYEDAMECIADVSSRSIVCQLHYGVQKMIAEADTIIPADPEGGADG